MVVKDFYLLNFLFIYITFMSIHLERAKLNFWDKVSKLSSCWEWTAAKDSRGYGCFGATKYFGISKAHRFSYFLHNGDIPKGMHVLHKCDNPSCVNPDHLFLGTNKDNMKDRDFKGRGIRPGHSDHPQTKIPDSLKDEIVEKAEAMSLDRGTSYGVYRDLSKEYDVSADTIAARCRGIDFGVPSHKVVKLTTRDREDIKKRNREGGRGIQRVLAEEYCVSKPLISKICRSR